MKMRHGTEGGNCPSQSLIYLWYLLSLSSLSTRAYFGVLIGVYKLSFASHLLYRQFGKCILVFPSICPPIDLAVSACHSGRDEEGQTLVDG